MTIEYLKLNFWVKNIFPKVPSRGVKVGKSKKYCNKVLQSAPCWYSKLVSRDAWFNRKGLSSIGSSCAEKTSKMCQNIGNCQNSKFSMVFGLFLGSHWSDWAQTFFIESGISRHKFRVPTRGTLKHSNFRLLPTLTPLEGTFGKIFLALKLHFSYSIVIEHQIKLCLVVFGLKGAILVGFWS